MQKSGPYVKGTNDLNESRSMSTTKVIGEGGGWMRTPEMESDKCNIYLNNVDFPGQWGAEFLE